MTDIALDKRAKFAAQLRNAANEMRAEDHNGWPVLCDIVADYLDASPSQVAPANPAQVTDAMVEAGRKAVASFNPCMGDDGDPCDTECHCRQVARAALISAIGAGGQAVAVKPLEWQWDAHTSQWWANSVVGQYHAWEIAGHAYFRAGAFSTERAGSTADAARAAAQADFERRIRSALSQPHPADERVVEALRKALKRLSTLYEGIYVKMSDAEMAACRDAWSEADDALASAEARNG